MCIHISCDMHLRLGLHVQIRLYYVLPYKAKISAQQGIGFILDRCIVHLGLTMPNLQKKRLLIFEIFNIKKCTLFFGTEYMFSSRLIVDSWRWKCRPTSLADMPAVSIPMACHVAKTSFQADVPSLIFKDFFPVFVLTIRKLSNCVLCDSRGFIRFAVSILHVIFINVNIYDYIMA